VNGSEILPLIGQGSIGAALAFVALWWHRDAVRAHDMRAQDAWAVAKEWQQVAARERMLSEERSHQTEHMLTAIRSQAEVA